MTNRLRKINELIKQEVGGLLEEKLARELGLVTLTNVETSSDLKQAKVWVSVFNEGSLEEVKKGLEEALPEIQRILNKRLEMKYVPKITFDIDQSASHAEHIEKLLKEIEENKKSS